MSTGVRGMIIDEVNAVDEIPPEAEEALHDPHLQEAVQEMPGSDRFKAMVLGLSALSALNPKRVPPDNGPHNP